MSEPSPIWEHPDWEHSEGEEEVRAATQLRLDAQEKIRQTVAEARKRQAAAKRWMIISILWCLAGCAFSIHGVSGPDWAKIAGFGCIMVSLVMSLIALVFSNRGEREARKEFLTRVRAWQETLRERQ